MAEPARVAGMPTAAKIPASRHCTWSARTFGTAPAAEATPITISEMGIASSTPKPRA